MFRTGATSYVVPDDLVTNARHLAGLVQDVELVLFDTPDHSNLPTEAQCHQLAEIAAQTGMTYTVHLPADLGSEDGLRLALRTIRTVEMLSPVAYIFHIQPEGVTEPEWERTAYHQIRSLVRELGGGQRLALENLESYAPDRLEWLFSALPVRRALDIGHLWKAGLAPEDYLPAWLPEADVVHLHAVHAGRDHQSLAHVPPALLDPLVRQLAAWDGVLTLEVFEDDFVTSLQALSASLQRLGLQ
jgi:sugar phosphate isomerase/epimerase